VPYVLIPVTSNKNMKLMGLDQHLLLAPDVTYGNTRTPLKDTQRSGR
jgi:hypothetical protein